MEPLDDLEGVDAYSHWKNFTKYASPSTPRTLWFNGEYFPGISPRKYSIKILGPPGSSLEVTRVVAWRSAGS